MITLRHDDVDCERGAWGINCDEKCDCVNADKCDTVTGECVCMPGWVGKRCEQRESFLTKLSCLLTFMSSCSSSRFLPTFLPPLPLSYVISSHNLPIFLIFCTLVVSSFQIFSVNSRLSFSPCVQPISSSS